MQQDQFGYNIVWHLTGPGTRGVDLIALNPHGDKVVVIEVKGTLRLGHRPRMSGRLQKQMTIEWLNKPDNPGMTEWGLSNEDVVGGIVQINFADMAMRVSLTRDFNVAHDEVKAERLSVLHALLVWTLGRVLLAHRCLPQDLEPQLRSLGDALAGSRNLDEGDDWADQLIPHVWFRE